MNRYIKISFNIVIFLLYCCVFFVLQKPIFASTTYNYTGGQQTYVVPAGITSITIEAYGAKGADDDAVGGNGGYTKGTYTVTPDETLYIYVGGQGSGATGGYNGGGSGGTVDTAGGGGGATDVRQGGTALTDRIIVAGGGGGGGDKTTWPYDAGEGGDGGAGTGEDGSNGDGFIPASAGKRGFGGTSLAGGAGGDGEVSGDAGSLGIGGNGGSNPGNSGGGGGGGYYGGGGGGSGPEMHSGGGGGGGSNYTGAGTNVTSTRGVNDGNGYVVITKNCVSTACTVTLSGSTCTSYLVSDPDCGNACTSRTSTCTDGSWDTAPYDYGTCTDTCCASGGCPQINRGAACITYSNPEPECDTSCASLKTTSICQSNLAFDLSPATYNSCISCCNIPWGGSINNGSYVTAYKESSAYPPYSCWFNYKETRTCNDATLTGSYTNESCIDYWDECAFPETMPQGGVFTMRNHCSAGTTANIITGVEDDNDSATDASNSASFVIDGSTFTIGSNDNQTVLFGQIRLIEPTTFYDKESYSAGSSRMDMLAGDINGDGEIDLIGAGSTTISILINNGDGTFASPTTKNTSQSIIGYKTNALHDVNGDGKPDIITMVRKTTVTSWDEYKVPIGWEYRFYVDVFINNGNGTFANSVTYPISGVESVANIFNQLMVGDVTGDGKGDIVYSKGTSTVGDVGVLINNGDGTFADYVEYSIYRAPNVMELHDVNGDGKLDILVTTYYSTNRHLNVLINNGDGTFAGRVIYSLTDHNPHSLKISDINGDNYPDVVIATYTKVSVFINNGDGTFANEAIYSISGANIASSYDPMVLSDVNGDGNLDVLVVGSTNVLFVLMGNSDGTFNDAVSYSLPHRPYTIKAADINNDEKPDLIIGINTTSFLVLVNKGDGTFDSPVPYTASDESYIIEIHDITGDGKLDILVCGANSSYFDVFIHKPKGSIIIAKDRGAQLVRGVRWILDADGDGKTTTATPSAVASAVRPSSSYVRKNYISTYRDSGNIAYYKMDETATSSAYLDSSGNMNTATVYGSASVASGKYNNGLYFDGSAYSYLYFGDEYAPAANNFSYSFWVNPGKTRTSTSESTSGTIGTSVNQSYAIFPKLFGSDDAGAGVSVGTNGVSVFEHGGNYLPSLLVHTQTLTGWNHIVVVYENKQPRLYINGQLKRTGLTSPRANVYSSNTSGGGTESHGTYGPFKGTLDEVRVFNRTLTTSEIYALYDAGKIFVTDCDDNDPDKWQVLSGYVDNDGDNYGTGELQQVCSGSTLLSGYGEYAGDCNDSDDTKWRNRYRDADGDGYGVNEATCVGDDAGYVDVAGDCYDSGTGAANVNPGVTSYFATHRGDGSFDYDCSGTEDKNPTYDCTRTYNTSCSSTQMPGYNTSVPACGSSASFYGVKIYSSSIACTFNSGATDLATCGTPPTSYRRSYTVGSVQIGCR